MTFSRTSLFAKTLTAATLLVSALAATGSANAALINEIRITSGYTVPGQAFIQIGEVVATQNGTGTDVALSSAGAIATSNGSYSGNPATDGPLLAIDGNTNQVYGQNGGIFHAGTTFGPSASDFLDIQLASVFDIDSITIFGRSDCCTERNVFNVSFLNSGAEVFSARGVDATQGNFTATMQLPAAVPEPTTVALLGLGLFGFAASRRKSAK